MIQHHAWSGPKHAATPPTSTSRRIATLLLVAAALVAPLLVASPAEAAPSQVRFGAHDTLWALAAKYCGNPYKWPSLAAGSGISDPRTIRTGQVIKLTCSAPVRTTANSASRSTTRTTSVPASGWVAPLARYSLTSCFGMRWGAMHQGIDMAAPSGTPIRAAHAGVVTRAGWVWHGYGISVVLNNGGVWTHYAHMSRLNVRAGQSVAAGQVIGYVGATGDASGPHLHFEVAGSAGVLGAQRNPASFLRAHGVSIGC